MNPSARRIRKSVHSAEQKLLRELLSNARDKAGLTQIDVAERLKTHQSFVAKYEGGERRLDVVEFIQICRAIDVDPVRILRAFLEQVG